MPLADIAVRKAAPRERPYKLADGGGLCLLIQPNGSKHWRLKYRFADKEKLLSLGSFLRRDLPKREHSAKKRRNCLRTAPIHRCAKNSTSLPQKRPHGGNQASEYLF
ncbi:MAG: Arm DNA-binding domain-containing protein [Xanthobacteraceae bacterium]